MDVQLIDGTYELFRYFYGAPSHLTAAGEEVAAVRGVVGSMLGLVIEGATHVGVATDHVVRSFRNDLYAGYKTEEGMDPAILGQFGLLEEALAFADHDGYYPVTDLIDQTFSHERLHQLAATPDMEVGPDGYLYVVSGFRGTDEGSIYRIVPNSIPGD